MTIQDDLTAITAALDDLVPKEDGNLVRSDDWNSLVGQVQALGVIVSTQQTNYESNFSRIESLESGLSDLTNRVQAVEDQIGEAEGDEDTILARLQDLEENKLGTDTFSQYQATLDPLLLQYTVTLETEDINYLLGEVATLTATVRRLDGSAVTSRPWLDFLVSWGDIQAVSGFDALPGAGGRSVSVHTNSQGIAKVRIKAENLSQTSEAVDNELQAFFATEVTNQNQTKVMSQAIKEAPDTQDGFMRKIYTETTQRYESGTSGLNVLLDKYYQGRYRGPGNDYFFPRVTWRDHRSTIAVFAKDDSNPETPDFGKGVSSIQINFRDWISPWIGDYKPEQPYADGPWLHDIPDLLRDDNYHPDILVGYIDEHLANRGLLGKHKALKSMGEVIRQMDDTVVNPGAGQLSKIIEDAVITQKNMDFISYGDEVTGDYAVVAMSQAVHQAAGTGEVKGQINSVESQVTDIGGKANSLESNYSILNDRVNETAVQGENVMLALGSIDNKVGNINVVDADSVRGSVSAIKADIAALRFNLEQ